MPDNPQLQPAILDTVRYSSLFSYPLTAKEIKHWLPTLTTNENLHSQLTLLVKRKKLLKKGVFYFLAPGKNLSAIRQKRKAISIDKFKLASIAASKLSVIPWIETIAVTGSLAMNNCDKDADIDLMIICAANTLWLTRLFVWLLLFPNRRSPTAVAPDQIKDKICDNVYLESGHLDLKSVLQTANRSFYLAHEILQAKPILNRHQTFLLFLYQNQWLGDILPYAWRSYRPSSIVLHSETDILSLVLFIPDFLAFLAQYFFMKGKITGESISLHRALFHPQLPLPISRFRLSLRSGGHRSSSEVEYPG